MVAHCNWGETGADEPLAPGLIKTLTVLPAVPVKVHSSICPNCKMLPAVGVFRFNAIGGKLSTCPIEPLTTVPET